MSLGLSPIITSHLCYLDTLPNAWAELLMSLGLPHISLGLLSGLLKPIVSHL